MSTTSPDSLAWSPEAAKALGSSPPQPVPLAWSPVDAAKRLGIGRATLYELMASGQIASLKVGARRLITDAECRRFLTARQAEHAEW